MTSPSIPLHMERETKLQISSQCLHKIINFSQRFLIVDVVEQKAWHCTAALLLLQMEKELEDEVVE